MIGAINISNEITNQCLKCDRDSSIASDASPVHETDRVWYRCSASENNEKERVRIDENLFLAIGTSTEFARVEFAGVVQLTFSSQIFKKVLMWDSLVGHELLYRDDS